MTATKTNPGFFRRLWNGWKWIGEKIGMVMSAVILTLLFFLVLPFWTLMRLRDPLRKRLGRQESYWEPYKNPPPELNRYRRPF